MERKYTILILIFAIAFPITTSLLFGSAVEGIILGVLGSIRNRLSF